MTEYKRCQGKSYMVFDTDIGDFSYERQMLEKNKIAGFLPLRAGHNGEGEQLWYEISGRQSLEELFERAKPEGAFLKKFMGGLSKAVFHAGKYLLREDGVSLAPEHIFMDAPEQEISFCYLPFQKQSFAQELREFMEYFISHMQHNGGAGERACYDVYEKCQESNVDLDELLSILLKETPQETAQEKAEGQEEQKEQKETGGQKEQKNKKKTDFFAAAKGVWHKTTFLMEKRRGGSVTAYAFAPEECGEQTHEPTVFLGSETERILGELRYEGDGAGKNFKLTPPVFVIGSRADKADGVIVSDTVSRIHAKLTIEGDGWLLEDLNSTNGTFLNGEPLVYRKKVKLEKNDRIAFAGERYRFV